MPCILLNLIVSQRENGMCGTTWFLQASSSKTKCAAHLHMLFDCLLQIINQVSEIAVCHTNTIYVKKGVHICIFINTLDSCYTVHVVSHTYNSLASPPHYVNPPPPTYCIGKRNVTRFTER